MVDVVVAQAGGREYCSGRWLLAIGLYGEGAGARCGGVWGVEKREDLPIIKVFFTNESLNITRNKRRTENLLQVNVVGSTPLPNKKELTLASQQ